MPFRPTWMQAIRALSFRIRQLLDRGGPLLVLQTRANHAQVSSQGVERARVPRGNADLPHSLFELVQTLAVLRKLPRRLIPIDPIVDVAQLFVDPVQAGIDEYIDDGGNRLGQRIED